MEFGTVFFILCIFVSGALCKDDEKLSEWWGTWKQAWSEWAAKRAARKAK